MMWDNIFALACNNITDMTKTAWSSNSCIILQEQHPAGTFSLENFCMRSASGLEAAEKPHDLQEKIIELQLPTAPLLQPVGNAIHQSLRKRIRAPVTVYKNVPLKVLLSMDSESIRQLYS